MVAIYCFSSGIKDKRRRSLVFQGALLVFKSVPGIKRLCAYVFEKSCDILQTDNPEVAHHDMSPADYLKRVSKLQRTYSHSPEAKDLFKAVLSSVGVNMDETYWCRTTLRIQPELENYINRATTSLPAHRDTWYSNVFQQNNWWLPIFPLASERTLEFYPFHWTRPIKNTSGDFDLIAFREAREMLKKAGASFESLQSAYPLATVDETLNRERVIKLLIEPGDILCFSGAHLHRGLKNNTDRARFSTEVRTVNVNDVRNNQGAPNIDGQSTGIALNDFYALQDENAIQEVLV